MKKNSDPMILIHGGAGQRPNNKELDIKISQVLSDIINISYQELVQKRSSQKAVVKAISLLEDCPFFNAGKGSAIQEDGIIRLSSGLMDGQHLRFSGAVNVRGIKNPILIADYLQKERYRVLDSLGAKKFSLEKEIPRGNPYTDQSLQRLTHFLKKHDTVGAVAIDRHGRIFAGTSTGGMTGAFAGRVSDTPTIAGTYANQFAGISATGVGEEITDHAVCAAIATRIEDGMPLKKAVSKTILKAKKFKAEFGLIALSKEGEWSASMTTSSMSWAIKTTHFTKVSPR